MAETPEANTVRMLSFPPSSVGELDWNATIVKPLATARSNSVVHRIEFIQDDGGPARYPKDR